jgi:hypothetical protein
VITAYLVLERFGEEYPYPVGNLTFVVAPRVGETLIVRQDEGSAIADVTRVTHSPTVEGVAPRLQIVALVRAEGEAH